MKNRIGNALIISGINTVILLPFIFKFNWFIGTSLIILLALGARRYLQGRISFWELLIPIIIAVSILPACLISTLIIELIIDFWS